MSHRLTHQPRTIEEGYFHSGNSGLTYRFTEREVELWSANPIKQGSAKLYSNIDYRFEITHGAFGERSTFSSPLTLPMVDYLLDALGRLKHRMEQYNQVDDCPAVPRDEPELPPGHKRLRCTAFDHSGRSDNPAVIAEGCKIEQVWSEAKITSIHSTSSSLIGHRYRDPQGQIVKVIDYVGPPVVRWGESAADTRQPQLYWPDEIGLRPADLVKGRVRPGEVTVVETATLI